MEFLLGMDLGSFIRTIGLVGIFAVVFAESGVLIGLFLPGDSLLFTAGLLASQGFVDIKMLMLVTFLGAVLGDSVGYAFGRRVGPRFFTREDSLIFRKEYIVRANEFYAKHGGKTIILARFLPIVRTLAPILAGVGRMRYETFLLYNVFGAILWAVGLTGLGFWLGNIIPGIDRYIIPIVLLIIIFSLLPGFFQVLKNKENRAYIKNLFSGLFNRFRSL